MVKDKLSLYLRRHLAYEPTPGQQRAMDTLTQFLTDPDPASLFLLRGYAGTGKTTLVNSLVQALEAFQIQCILLAPTGRAAKVLSGYTGRRANTIHKTIYHQRIMKDGRIMLVPSINRLKRTLFIVDEASMIQDTVSTDTGSFSGRNVLDDLYNYVYNGERCRLMFIGDTAQLPPVGMEISPALSEMNLKAAFPLKIYSVEMTEVVRQSEDSGILHHATLLREKLKDPEIQLPLLNLDGQTDVEKISGYDLQEALSHSGMYENTLESVVITRSNKRANLFNQQIRNRVLFREDEISVGDMLMIVKNNYYWLEETSQAGFLANGDIIEVRRISGHQERYGFHFADITCHMVDYPEQPDFEVKILVDTLMTEGPSISATHMQNFYSAVMEDYPEAKTRRKKMELIRLDPFYNALQIKYAYAMTCHKTQGGQWPIVFIDQGYLTKEHINREYLRWLYTALTRSTRKVYLIGFSEEIVSQGS